MAYSDYKKDLLADEFGGPLIEYVLDRYYHSGHSAVFTGAVAAVEPKFRRDLANQIASALQVQCHPLQVFFCGSAHLGFSPVPNKLGKPFNSETSDIDVAVISPEIFDQWRNELLAADLLDSARARVAENLFWGFINPASVHDATAFGKSWWKLFGDLQTERAKSVRGRIYRSHWFMQNYHRHAIVRCRDVLMGKRV